MPKFTEFFLPSAIPDRKAAAGAVAAGFFVAVLLAFLSGVTTAILLIRNGSTPTALLCASCTIAMTLIAIGTWKRIWLSPLIGLLISVATVIWQLALGKVTALVLIVPLVGGFWTAMRGIAFFKRNDAERRVARNTQ
jgi:hypothetical protein